MIENPADLAGGEIRVDHQAGLAFDGFARLERIAIRRGTAALPDDRGRDGVLAAPIPYHGSLALIRDADRVDFGRLPARLRQGGLASAKLLPPDLAGGLLPPAGLQIPALDRTRFHRNA